MSLTTLAAFATPYTACLAQVRDLQRWLDAHEQHWLRLVASSIHRFDKSFIAAARRHAAWIAGRRNALLKLEWLVQDAMDVLHAQIAHLQAAMVANEAALAQLIYDLHDITISLSETRSSDSSTTSTALLDYTEEDMDEPDADLRAPFVPAAPLAVAMEPRSRPIRRGRCASRSLLRRRNPRPPSTIFISATRSPPTPPAPPALHTHPQRAFVLPSRAFAHPLTPFSL